MKHQKLVLLFILLLGIASTIVYGKLFKDDEVKNVFDEIYFSGAPKVLNYHLAKSSASTIGTGCIKYREEEHVAEFAGIIDESLRNKCLKEEVNKFKISYFKEPHSFSMNIITRPKYQNDRNIIFGLSYSVEDKKINFSYRHNFVDGIQINGSKNEKIPEEYYQKYNITRSDLVEKSDEFLFKYFLTLYFDKNKENGNASRFSMENLGEYTVEYHF